MRREPYIIRLTGITNGNTPVILSAPAIPPGSKARVRWVAVDNQSGETVSVRFGFVDILGYHHLTITQNAASALGVGVLVDWWLMEGDRLSSHTVGTANKSNITLFAYGELYIDDPPGAQ
jgi:hypothetical protein